MKLNNVFFTSLSIFISSSSLAATIYTNEDGSNINLYSRLGFNITDKGGDSEGKFDGRIGFRGTHTINEYASLIGQAQYQIAAAEFARQVNDGSSFVARYVWAGIDGKEYGRITGGRVASGLIMFTDIADVFAASDVTMARQVSLVDATATQVFRQDGTLQYQNSFGDFDASVAYILGNSTSDLEYGANAAIRYTLDLGELGILAPVFAIQKNEGKNSNVDYKFYGVGTRYYIGDLILGGLYSEDDLKNFYLSPSKDKVTEFTAIYDIDHNWALRLGYRHLKNTGGDYLEVKDITGELQLKLTPSSSIYALYVDRNGENGKVGENEITFGGANADESFYHLGLRYQW